MNAVLLCLAALLAAPEKKDPFDLPFEKYTLKNGLEVILHSDRARPVVAISVWYHVGAMHESPGRSGFAHLFEHVTFQQTAHIEQDAFMGLLRQAGGSQINGVTGSDYTKYFATVPSHQIELALWLESERMGFLIPALTAESLANQKAVVKAEKLQNVHDRPYGLLDHLIIRRIYKKRHPLYEGVIGSMDDVQAATLDDVRDFYAEHYTPANATLALAGDFEIADAKAMIERYFGTLRGRAKPKAPHVQGPTVPVQIMKAYEPVGRRPRISMVWNGPPPFSHDTFELAVFAHLMSSRTLSRAGLVNLGDRAVQRVSAALSQDKLGSVFSIEAILVPGANIDTTQNRLEVLLRSYRSHALSKEIVNAAKAEIEVMWLAQLGQVGGRHGRANALQFANHYFGDPGKLKWYIDELRAPTAKSVSAAIAIYLKGSQLVVHAEPVDGKLERKKKK